MRRARRATNLPPRGGRYSGFVLPGAARLAMDLGPFGANATAPVTPALYFAPHGAEQISPGQRLRRSPRICALTDSPAYDDPGTITRPPCMCVWTVCSRPPRSPIAELRRNRRTSIARLSPASGCLPVLCIGAGTASLLRDDLPLGGCARYSANFRARWGTSSFLLPTPLRTGTVICRIPTVIRAGTPAKSEVRHSLHADPHRLRTRLAVARTTQPTPQRRNQADHGFHRRGLRGGGSFLTVAYTARHSSSSNATSQGRSGHSRPIIITYMIRQATIISNAR